MTKKEIINELGKPKIDEMMDEDQYWLIIQNSIENSKGLEDQYDTLYAELEKLSLTQIIKFRVKTFHLLSELFTSELWCASTIINKSESEEIFIAFRAWIISKGSDVYFNAKENPDSLINVLDSELDYEEYYDFLFVSDEVFNVLINFSDTLELISNHKIEDFFEYNGNPIVYNPIFHNDDEFNWSIDDPDSMKRICPILYDYYPKFKLRHALKYIRLVISNLIK